MVISNVIVKQKLQHHLHLAYTLGVISPCALPQKMQGTTFYIIHSIKLSGPQGLRMQRYPQVGQALRRKRALLQAGIQESQFSVKMLSRGECKCCKIQRRG